jgi:hypothetical protein
MNKCMVLLVTGLAQAAVAAPSRPAFHRAVYALHQQQVERHAIRTEERSGDYKGVAAAGYRYRITSYFDAANGRLLSRVERDLDRPDNIIIVEVNLYDDHGRVDRDYLSIAPPWKPEQPSWVGINLHHYSGKLHAVRQFDIDGVVNYEFCNGEFEGGAVKMALDWDDLHAMASPSTLYHACFDGMRHDWERYVTPH